jgi:hypothetical protein
MNGIEAPRNLMQNFAKNVIQSTSSLANSAYRAANVVSDMAVQSTSSLGNAFNSGMNSAMKVTNTAMKASMSSLPPAVNSIMPFGNGTTTSTKGVNSGSSGGAPWWVFPIGIFLLLSATFLMVFMFYKPQLNAAYNNIIQNLRGLFGKSSKMQTAAGSGAAITPPAPVTKAPQTPEHEAAEAAKAPSSLLDKILPSGSKEVFNVSSNEFTYYDAEPLCMALGAELATYDQVKQAWSKGADWCNYGWVKGQVAVYPTQKETWDKLQNGPEDEKYACGEPGVNGGAFDNPEMRFGVNCYGTKPPQSASDERILMEKGSIPKTPATLKVDQQIKKFKEHADTFGVLPFNNSEWDSS